MIDLSEKTYWLIGASEGLGRELAKELDKSGARLILSARNHERLLDLTSTLKNARMRVLDVTNADDVKLAVEEIGTIDGVIYNAGFYEPMRATDWDTNTALMMVDVNFTGVMHVLGSVMPRFVSNDKGDVTLIGSLAGYRGLPASIGYGASKAALISLAETMRHDLKNTGVIIRVINPGFIKTRLTAKNTFKMPMLMTPQKAATRVVKAMQSKRFRTDFPAPFSWLLKTLSFVPDILFYRGK